MTKNGTSLTVALDFDGTFAAHPEVFSLCVRAFRLCGAKVITVTSRRKTIENRKAMEALGVDWPIIFAYDKPKKLAAIEAGHYVDVWIDDNPHGIGDGTENVATQSVFQIELQHAHDEIRRLYIGHPSITRLLERMRTVLDSGSDAEPVKETPAIAEIG